MTGVDGMLIKTIVFETDDRSRITGSQDLEWRLRVATSVASGSGPPEPPRAPKPPPSTPSPSQAPSTPSTVDTRDVIIEGLRMETEALKAALAQARAEAQRVSRDDVP